MRKSSLILQHRTTLNLILSQFTRSEDQIKLNLIKLKLRIHIGRTNYNNSTGRHRHWLVHTQYNRPMFKHDWPSLLVQIDVQAQPLQPLILLLGIVGCWNNQKSLELEIEQRESTINKNLEDYCTTLDYNIAGEVHCNQHNVELSANGNGLNYGLAANWGVSLPSHCRQHHHRKKLFQ